jgi:hypothetical protein
MQGDVTHNPCISEGEDRKSVVIVDVIGPGFDNVCVSDIVTKVEPQFLRK